MKFKINKIFLALIGSVVISTVPVKNANALGWGVSDVELLGYLSGTVGGSGAGVVELLTGINAALADSNAVNKNQFANQLSNERERADIAQKSEINDRHKLDVNACSSATTASGGGSAAAGTASGGYSSAKNSMQVILDPTPRAEKYVQILNNQSDLGLCTAADIKLQAFGCASGANTDYSDSQGNGLSLIYPAIKDSDEGKVVPIGGLNSEQQAIRAHNLQLAVGVDNLSQLQSKSQAQSLPGSAYEAKRQQQNIRKTVALSTPLKEGAIENTVINVTDSSGKVVSTKPLSGFLKNGKIGLLDWSGDSSATGPRKVWANVFGSESDGVKFPTTPSEWDYLTYQVYSRYANTGEGSLQSQIASMSGDDILKELFRMNAVGLRMQMINVENQRDTNLLLSMILATLNEKNDDSTQTNLKSQTSLIVAK